MGRLAGFKRGLVEIGVFSAAINLLVLVTPLYMLQVYDRVLPSSSIDTLVYLSIIAAVALAVLGALEVVRAIYANRMATQLDVSLGADAFIASLTGPRAGVGDVQPLRDLATVRSFVASRSVFFLFDLPFAPFFVAVLYFLHPVLFLITVLGAVLLMLIAWANQAATGKTGQKSAEALAGSMNTAQSFVRNQETVRALGMTSSATEVWGRKFADALVLSDRVAATNAAYGGASRFIRLLLQSAILGVGAYLVLQGSMTAGIIFAASLISAKALQPFDQIIGSWRQVVETGRAFARLRAMAEAAAGRDSRTMALPAPKGDLAVEQLVYAPPGSNPGRPLIKQISFVVAAGETVAIIGPSRAGKSTLARLIVGALAQNSGLIRLDGADTRTWDSDALGRHIGYLAQEVELFAGTIADNIARFDPAASDERIIEAAQNANAHQLILSQDKGYLTEIGPGGLRLSGGERQRIGLARAFYGAPRVMVLDEPNANLDAEGEQALEKAIAAAGKRGITVLLITHKPSIATKCDRILMLRDGQIELYGPATDVIQRLAQGGTKQQPAPANTTPAVADPVQAGTSYSTPAQASPAQAGLVAGVRLKTSQERA